MGKATGIPWRQHIAGPNGAEKRPANIIQSYVHICRLTQRGEADPCVEARREKRHRRLNRELLEILASKTHMGQEAATYTPRGEPNETSIRAIYWSGAARKSRYLYPAGPVIYLLF